MNRKDIEDLYSDDEPKMLFADGYDEAIKGVIWDGERTRFAGDLGTYYIPFLISIGLGFAAYVVMVLGIMGAAFLGAAVSGGAA